MAKNKTPLTTLHRHAEVIIELKQGKKTYEVSHCGHGGAVKVMNRYRMDANYRRAIDDIISKKQKERSSYLANVNLEKNRFVRSRHATIYHRYMQAMKNKNKKFPLLKDLYGYVGDGNFCISTVSRVIRHAKKDKEYRAVLLTYIDEHFRD
jgi:hypothetical protein